MSGPIPTGGAPAAWAGVNGAVAVRVVVHGCSVAINNERGEARCGFTPLLVKAKGDDVAAYSMSAMASRSPASSFSVAVIISREKLLISRPVTSCQSPLAQTIGRA